MAQPGDLFRGEEVRSTSRGTGDQPALSGLPQSVQQAGFELTDDVNGAPAGGL